LKYEKIYNNIIQNRLQNPPLIGYTENHHIIPRSLGGNDSKENIVTLTAREHFLCHYLLAKMYPKDTIEWYKMNHAFLMMKYTSRNQTRYFNSKLYEALRNNFSGVMSFIQKGMKNSQYGTCWVSFIDPNISKRIKKEEVSLYIDQGWILGRNAWNKIKKTNIKYDSHIKIFHYEKSKKQAEYWYQEFLNSGVGSLREFVRKSNYDKSHVSFIKMLKKHISEFEPKRGKAYTNKATGDYYN
jgi:hypothetical protein